MATYRSVLALGVAVLPLLVASGAEAAPPTASYACRADTKFGRHLLSLRVVGLRHLLVGGGMK